MKISKFKIGLLISGLALSAYGAQLWLDKRAQWAAFLELEQEQLAIVTADGFIEREFGVGSNRRSSVTHVSSYSRYLNGHVADINEVEAIKAFLMFAPEPVFKDFTLAFLSSDGKYTQLGYPVSWCEDSYCPFDSDLIRRVSVGGPSNAASVYHKYETERRGYKFELHYILNREENGNIYSLNVSVGSEPRNILDEILAALNQTRSGYRFRPIYHVDYVTGWAYYREEWYSG